MDNSRLDDLVLTLGEVLDENIQYVNKQQIQKQIDNLFAYDDKPVVIPGEKIENKINAAIDQVNELTGLNSLITQSAMVKAKNEAQQLEKTLTKEQKAAIRKQFVEQMLYQQGELYYQQHHYIMDGHTKRVVRKKIERAYDKGKFNKNGLYFEKPKMRTVVKKQKDTNTNKTPVNVKDLI